MSANLQEKFKSEKCGEEYVEEVQNIGEQLRCEFGLLVADMGYNNNYTPLVGCGVLWPGPVC